MPAKEDEWRKLSPMLLRDLCQCAACIHHSTRQKLFSTTDIPRDIRIHSIAPNPTSTDVVDILWDSDVPGYDAGHVTSLDTQWLQGMCKTGATPGPFQGRPMQAVAWNAQTASPQEFDYEAYIRDDKVLYSVTEQLQTHGLVFISNVPSSEKSVSAIAERIGPLKSTFYGDTWDVRNVPSAINAAYTSSDLGFHSDLLYFQNPAHIQLLHCMQASCTGGASVFVDAFKCAGELYTADRDVFDILATLPVNYHYMHPDSNLYYATKPVIETGPHRIGDVVYDSLPEFLDAWQKNRERLRQSLGTELPSLGVMDCLEKINWGPPFLAPFSLQPESMEQARSCATVAESLNWKIDAWHGAAKKFNDLLNRRENLYERTMQPGDCVLFDNTRILHARGAFDSTDVEKVRWLRGTYLDKEPFLSKLRVLKGKFEVVGA